MTTKLFFAALAIVSCGAVRAEAPETTSDETPQEMSGEALSGTPDPAAGETLYQESCKNCHGPEAQGMASFPKLAGHEADYLTDRLTRYRAGERVGPNTALMRPHAQDLSDQEILDLAAYISTAFE